MGCDIHSYVERKYGDRWEDIAFHPFSERNYGAFAFLAGVRNYSGVVPLSEPRGLPADMHFVTQGHASDWKDDAHSASWLSLSELTGFDYDSEMEDRRCSRQMPGGWISGGETCEPGDGRIKTWNEFLGPAFMRDLEMLKGAGPLADVRVVFWFDN